MGLFDSLFGGKTQYATTETNPWGPQIPYLKNMFSRAENLYSTQQLPGANPAERSGFQGMLSYAQGALPQYAQAAMQSNQFLMNPDLLSPGSNPYLRSYMDTVRGQIMQGLTESALPAITGGAAATGNIGSSRQGVAEALATQRALREVGGATAGLASSAYGQGLQAMLGAQGRAPAMAALGALPSQLEVQAGSGLRQLDTLPYANELKKLRDYQSLISGNYGGTVKAPVSQSGGLAGALGGLASGAGIVSGLTDAGLLAAGSPWGWGIMGLGALAGLL